MFGWKKRTVAEVGSFWPSPAPPQFVCPECAALVYVDEAERHGKYHAEQILARLGLRS